VARHGCRTQESSFDGLTNLRKQSLCAGTENKEGFEIQIRSSGSLSTVNDQTQNIVWGGDSSYNTIQRVRKLGEICPEYRKHRPQRDLKAAGSEARDRP
jgi:hypothetical protein